MGAVVGGGVALVVIFFILYYFGVIFRRPGLVLQLTFI